MKNSDERWMFIGLLVCALVLAITYGVCTQDDAFISFRYAENLANGHGLVFNPGQRVEGFSNPLWTLIFSVIIAVGLDPVFSSVLLGYLSIAFLGWSTHRLAKSLGVIPLIAVAAVLLDPGMLLEGVQGLETVFYSGLITLGLALTIDERAKEQDHWHSTLVFAAAMLTRPEAPLLIFLIHLGLCIQDQQWKRSLMKGRDLLGVLLLIFVLRLGYYGELFPNTYHAKVGGMAIGRGLEYLKTYTIYHPLMVLSLCFTMLSKKEDNGWMSVLSLCGGLLVYLLVIGGDFKPTGRFVLPVTGALACCVAHLGSVVESRSQRWLWPALLALALIARGHMYVTSLGWAKDRRQNLVARKVIGLWLREHTDVNTLLAIHSVGVIPYYAKRRTIDMWGLTDKVIARTPVKDFGKGLAGHERRNPNYVFAQQPDIYLPEDQLFQPQQSRQTVEEGFPGDFEQRYRPISVKIEGSWLNIWLHNDFRLRPS